MKKHSINGSISCRYICNNVDEHSNTHVDSSGHMVGAAMVAIYIYEPMGCYNCDYISVNVQGIFFGDGGLTTIGANIINMGICGGFVGYYTLKGYMVQKWVKMVF